MGDIMKMLMENKDAARLNNIVNAKNNENKPPLDFLIETDTTQFQEWQRDDFWNRFAIHCQCRGAY